MFSVVCTLVRAGILRRKYQFQEFYVNEGKMRKLYCMYLDKPIYNKILDKLVFLAMIVLAATFLVHFFVVKLPVYLLWVINIPTAFILAVFILEIIRMYMHSHSKREFLQKHWLDFILVSFLSFYFLFLGTMGILKSLKIFEAFAPLAHDAKDARVFYRFFKFK